MSLLLICVYYLGAADSSRALPDPVRALAKNADAFADSIAKLNEETDAVARDAELVHNVSANKTARALILDDMGRTLKRGMPSADAYDDAETDALKAAAAYKTADLAARQAALRVQQQVEADGKGNLTAAEEAKLQADRKAAQEADAESTSARRDLQAAVAKAEDASTALLEATRAHVRKFEEHVGGLMHAARTHEAEAKKAMRAAISSGRKAADAEYRNRTMGEQSAEEARGLAEEWAEGHEEAIEHASDHANDDLERIYAPVMDLARHVLDVAERNDHVHRLHVQGLVESGKRVEMLQMLRGVRSSATETPWFLWAGSAGAATAAALLVAISRRRMKTGLIGTGLQKPLLG